MKNFKKKAGFLFALAVGGAAGFYVSAQLFLSDDLFLPLTYLIIGLIVASSVPSYFLPEEKRLFSLAAVAPFGGWSVLMTVLLTAEGDIAGGLLWLGLAGLSTIAAAMPLIIERFRKKN